MHSGEILNTILTFLSNIPIAFWTALLATTSTLAGVLISNKSNTSRILMQLKHDAQQKSIERTHEIRRKIYLELVSEYNKATTHLTKLPALELGQNPADGFMPFFNELTKATLIVEPSTSEILLTAQAAFGKVMFSAMSRATSVNQVRHQITIVDDLYQKHLLEQERIFSEIKNWCETPGKSKAVLEALNISYEHQTELVDHYAEKRGDAWDKFNKFNAEYQSELFNELQCLRVTQDDVFKALRKELDFSNEYPDGYYEKQNSVFNSLKLQINEQFKKWERSTDLPS
ncbi:hypothetical protein [Methylovorus mays]|uniref:hypothetical protein n=1 Tax=Methylovorus mays TaxID=184077 RepID=UPI001E30F40B|nr:hypothetical protein [Methylovorus mays]MCB5207804.1 hypothetical protein [Methylovorus mays]